MFALQVTATVMGSNETGIGSPIAPVSEVENVSVCGCESWRLTSELIRFSVSCEEAFFFVWWVGGCVRGVEH